MTIHALAPNVFWMPPDHTTDRPVLGAVIGDDATLLVDAGNSPAHARLFLAALEARSVPPIRYVALTHAHWDHVFGAAAIDATIIASEATARELEAMAAYDWSDAALDERVAAGLEIPFCRDMIQAELTPADRAVLSVRPADRTFRDELELDLGNQPVRLVHVGGDHASDSTIVVVPRVAVFLGDCIYRNLHVEPNELTRRNLYPLLDRLLGLDVVSYLAAHDDAPMTRSQFTAFAGDYRAIGDAVAAGRDVPLPAGRDPSIADVFRAGLRRDHAG